MAEPIGTIQTIPGARSCYTRFTRHTAQLLAALGLMLAVILEPGTSHGAETLPEPDRHGDAAFARERGHETLTLSGTSDHGELLPFAFLLAGAAGGFVAGYYWRMLLEGGGKKTMHAPGKRK